MAKPKQAPKALRTRSRSNKKNQPWHQSSSARNVLTFALLALVLVFASTFFTKGSTVRKGKSTPKKPAPRPAESPLPSKSLADPTVPPIQPPSRQLWKRTATGVNKGVVATEDITGGDLLIYAKPLITVKANENRTSPTMDIIDAINQLSVADRGLYFNLPYNAHKLDDDSPQEAVALNVWEANAVHAGPTSSIFIDPAYIQHSCLPNADYFYREDIGALVVHAVKPIAKGEEITCPYFDASVLTREERQEHMHSTRGYGCSCQACSYEGEKLEQSDKNRARLGEIKKLIQGYSVGEVEPEAVLEGIEEAYELLKTEQYLADHGWWAGTAVQIGAAHSDPVTVMKWAPIAKEYYEIEAGKDSPQAIGLGIISEEPFRSSAWGVREPRWMTGGEAPESWKQLVEEANAQRLAREEAQASFEETQAAFNAAQEAAGDEDEEDLPEADSL